MKSNLCLSFLVVLLFGQLTMAQVQISGQLDIVARNTDAADYSNKTFAGFSNYDFLRARLFFDAQPSENVTVFTQIFISDRRFVLYAAYLRLSFFDQNLNMHLGLIPNTVGIWGPRTYSDKNPFIAMPLVHNYHTAYDFRSISNDITAFSASRGQGYNFGGLPLLYDFCWNAGVELFGSYGIIDWSVAANSGSETHPSLGQEDKYPQFSGRLVFLPVPEINFSFSGFWGPYLYKDDLKNLPGITKSQNEYINKGAGIGLILSKGYFEIFSESFWTAWDHPYYKEISAWSSYADFKYKFATQWYAAVRFEVMRFSDLEYQSFKDTWDYPLNRYEFVIGYHFDRNVLIKLDTQLTNNLADDAFDDEIYALQVSTSF